MIKCIHFVTVDGIGGVECAARSCIEEERPVEGLHIHVMYLSGCISFRKDAPRSKGKISAFKLNSFDRILAHINNPAAHLWALVSLIRKKPDVLVCSLWRGMTVGILYKLLFPRVRFVCFLHAATTVHAVDRGLNHMAMRMAAAIWADSKTTLTARVPGHLQSRKPTRVISFILKKAAPETLPGNSPVFAYWGRLD